VASVDALRASAASEPPAHNASLVCAYLDLTSHDLSYGVFAPASGVRDCWAGLEQSSPEAYAKLRVWEQLGLSSRPDRLAALHKAAVAASLLPHAA
jgi:hypothetical protein